MYILLTCDFVLLEQSADIMRYAESTRTLGPAQRTHYSCTDDIIILLNFIFTGLHSYEITLGLSTNRQRHRLLLLKTGIHVVPTYLQVILSFGNLLRDSKIKSVQLLEETLKKFLR